jgi:hypothetical protein
MFLQTQPLEKAPGKAPGKSRKAGERVFVNELLSPQKPQPFATPA